MKKITINGETWFYKITSYRYDEYGCQFQAQTSFFKEPNIVKTTKKYVLFGPLIDSRVENPTPHFTIPIEITNPSHTKEEVSGFITKELVRLKRLEEINQNQII